MVCPPVRRDNPLALAIGLSTVQADEPCSIVHSVVLAHYGVSRAKDFGYLVILIKYTIQNS